jgi:hypothetical protein
MMVVSTGTTEQVEEVTRQLRHLPVDHIRGVSLHFCYRRRDRRAMSRGLFTICSRHSTTRLYTSLPASRDWRTAGHPPPRSILDDSTEPVDLTEDNDAVNGLSPHAPPIHLRTPPARSTPEVHASHRRSMKKTFPEGWSPPRKLSREAMDGLRQLHSFDRETFSTPVLAAKFKISPEAVRRILKSKWEPTREQRARFAERERKRRETFIQMTRLQERMRALELAREGIGNDTVPNEDLPPNPVRGRDPKDKLSFR